MLLIAVTAVAAFSRERPHPVEDAVELNVILRGRALVLEYACSGCHGGTLDPADERWMIGMNSPDQEFLIGPCALEAGATQCFRTRPRNLTPDNTTGLGRFSERQIFNALRFGLRPGETADVEITSSTPGVGNFPEHPKYLAPPMPWPAWRHMPDEDLWAIAAYLKRGLKPVNHHVADSEGPPDFWASTYTEEKMGAYPAPPFPTVNEVEPPAALREKVLRGRHVVIEHDCGDCHGGWVNPAADGWLVGAKDRETPFRFGACILDAKATPCFRTYPRNLTPHETTGTGRYSEQQIFNALRFGLKPEFGPDADISADRAHFPGEPRFLAPTMPWAAWRHMSDSDLWAVVAYLKHGLKPVENEVPVSDEPEDFWASESTVEKTGPYPPPPFPTAREVKPAG
jgi:mono/diheme cytochrome c family protein